MKKNVWLIFAGVAVLITLIIYLLSPEKPRYDWSLNFKRTSNQPYGLQFLYNLMVKKYGTNQFVEIKNPIRENPDVLTNRKHALYFIAGGWLYHDSTAQHAVLNFVSEGNSAFLAADYIPTDIYYSLLNGKISDTLSTDINYFQLSQFEDSIVSVHLLHPDFLHQDSFRVSQMNDWKTYRNSWNYFFYRGHEQVMDSVVELGSIQNDYVNFIRIKYGNGYFYLHSTPVAFTNFHLAREEGFQYLQNVFNHFDAHTFIWDEASKLPFNDWRTKPFSGEGPLKFVLNNRSLRWAWYLLLFAVLLFILFSAKRKQKIIEVTEPNLNTSLEFVQTVGRLYFLQNDHLALTKQKMKLLLLFIRNRYKIVLKNYSDSDFEKLSIKSEIDFRKVKHIFTTYKILSARTSISSAELIEFHQSIDHFYKNCK